MPPKVVCDAPECCDSHQGNAALPQTELCPACKLGCWCSVGHDTAGTKFPPDRGHRLHGQSPLNLPRPNPRSEPEHLPKAQPASEASRRPAAALRSGLCSVPMATTLVRLPCLLPSLTFHTMSLFKVLPCFPATRAKVINWLCSAHAGLLLLNTMHVTLMNIYAMAVTIVPGAQETPCSFSSPLQRGSRRRAPCWSRLASLLSHVILTTGGLMRAGASYLILGTTAFPSVKWYY